MNCPNCNKEIDINNEVCPYCGSALYIQDNTVQYKKCQFCDNDIEINCIKCPYCKRKIETANRKGFATILLIVLTIFITTYLSLTNMLNFNVLGKEKNDKLDCSKYARMPIHLMNENIIQKNVKDKYINNTFNFVDKLSDIKTDENNKKYLEIISDYIILNIYLDDNEYEKINTLESGKLIYFCGTIKEINNTFGGKVIIKNAILI